MQNIIQACVCSVCVRNIFCMVAYFSVCHKQHTVYVCSSCVIYSSIRFCQYVQSWRIPHKIFFSGVIFVSLHHVSSCKGSQAAWHLFIVKLRYLCLWANSFQMQHNEISGAQFSCLFYLCSHSPDTRSQAKCH